jgi:hypothetical protein
LSDDNKCFAILAECANCFVLRGVVLKSELTVTRYTIEVCGTFEYFTEEAESDNYSS